MRRNTRDELAEKIAGEITLSDDPGATLRKWRMEFEISQRDLATEIDVSSSVISDYESGRRENPGTGFVQRIVGSLIEIDKRRGATHIQMLSVGFDNDIVLDISEYPTNLPLDRFYREIEATELAEGDHDSVTGHTVIDSIQAIRWLSSDEFYDLYGRSTNRALVFTNNSHGKGALVALRVVKPMPNAAILHGIDVEDVWEHAPDLARMEGFSLAVTTMEMETLLETLRDLS